jgi:calcium-activated chloride channel regulator 4
MATTKSAGWYSWVIGATLLLILAGRAHAQTLITGDCYADDFMGTVNGDQVFDISISLWTTPSPADRANYEDVLRNFARGIFEMSNGQHKIRNITIYQDGKRKRFANVIWSKGISQQEIDANPNDAVTDGIGAVTHMGGILDQLGKIYMYDDQQDILATPIVWTDLVRGNADQRKLEGYILSHEFSHYAYSLGDEYTPSFDGSTGQIVSVMSDVQQAVKAGTANDNLQWLNFSTTNSLNYASKIADTTQYSIHGNSSWDFLQQSCATRRRTNMATGVFMPDMGASQLYTHFPKSAFYTRFGVPGVAPTSSNTWLNPNDGVTYPSMKPDLYGVANPGNPTDHVNVIWTDSANVEMDLILDNSGSMIGPPIQKVIQAAQKFAGLAIMGRTTLGVTTFESTVNPGLVPMTPINSAADIAAIQQKIGTITVGDNTALYLAAKDSLDKVQAYHSTQGTTALETAFLLSDGHDNFSGAVTQDQVISLYKGAGVRLHTVGYADRASSESFLLPLHQLADGTGGTYFHSLTEAADIADAMRVAYGDILTVQDITLSGLGTPFPIDTFYFQLNFDINYRLNAGGGLTLAVQSPSGGTVPSSIVTSPNDDGSFTAIVVVNQAAVAAAGTGYWRLMPTFTGTGGSVVSQQLHAMPGAGAPIELMISSKKNDYVYPEPVQLYARTVLDGDVTSLNVNAHLIAPDGSTIPVVMTDDGTGNDSAAFDGLYSAQIPNLQQNGTYTLDVGVENVGTAVYIRPRGEVASNGAPLSPVYVPVGVPFARDGKVVFTVNGITADDHGNAAAVATGIAPDYAPHYGKIETAGDVDFFRVDGAPAGQPLNVRVYDQRFGFSPKVTIYAADGATALKSGSLLLGATTGGYLSVNVPGAQVISPLYVKVEDQAGGAGGTYTIDVGATVASDQNVPAPFITRLPNGDLQFAISFAAHQGYVEVIAQRNGAPLVSGNIVGSEINNGDGTFTYSRVVPASTFTVGDKILARYDSFEPGAPAVLTPGPTPDVWLPTYTYGGTFTCPVAPVGACQSTLLTPVAASASSTESSTYPAAQVIDHDFSLRWSSAFADPQWVMLDLGATRFIHRAILYWEDAASSDYDIQVSDNATTWTTVYTDHAGNGGTDDVTGLNATGRYVRVYSRHRLSQYGNSLWEVLLWGDTDTSCRLKVAPARPCFPRDPVRVGSINLERWNNISGAAVSNIPTSTPPDLIQAQVTLEGPHNAAENYGVRMRGWLTPPTSGNYTFWISGDDQVALYLSPDVSAANKTRIAHHEAYTGFREWNKYSTQKSTPIALTKGRWYYIEALMKEQSGDDSVSVGWLKPGETGSQPSELVPATALAPFSDSSLPPPVAVGYHSVTNVNSSKCVDVAGASTSDGANVQQLTCAGSDGGQQFDLRSRGDGLYWIVNRISKKCVHVASNSTSSGANVEQRTCDGSTSSIWQLVPLTGNQYRAVSLKSAKCLDVVGASTSSGANIQQATCSSTLGQSFVFTAL